MNRIQILSFFVVVCGTGALIAGTAQSQSGQPKNIVYLQSSTPGTSQSGHVNVTGTVIAEKFTGDGGGITGVNAETLGGLPSSSFLQNIPNPLVVSGSNASSATIYGANSSPFGNSSAITAQNFSTSGSVFGLYAITESVGGAAINAVSNSVIGTAPAGKFHSVSPNSFGIEVTTQGPTAVYGVSNSTTSSAAAGYFYSTSSTAVGVRGHTNGGVAGVFGTHSSGSGDGAGGLFSTTSSGGVGVEAVASATTGNTIAGLFTADSTSGVGVSASGGSKGIFAEATGTGTTRAGDFLASGTTSRVVNSAATATTGASFAGYFTNQSTSGTGIYALANATTGTTYAGIFDNQSTSAGAYAVYATSEGRYGVLGLSTGVSGRGVYGNAGDASPGTTPYGVLGFASTATNGFGVFATGDMGASGIKPFRIDHPHDPENKYLMHYANESPFPQNVYNGNVTTDSSGYAWVDMPDYFDDVNTNIKYQLTVVDDADASGFVQAKVSKKMKGGRFQVRTSEPGVEVSWVVWADRNDARIKWRRPTDVVEKSASERGLYQHPEYYGKPAEMSITYVEKPPVVNQNRRK